ncbi:hypothetical protein BDZ85DRAFT_317669 [Elsinoe ampelina]|uniref:RRM domain-containing protein n=1 Tax=Elsinoe ampelina TaxID=302913 RepID=A0A6A6GHH1_9PEZI|nr:hypothetical protein BDZ85DRAFT_317669 [Elsinoe ampelina]
MKPLTDVVWVSNLPLNATARDLEIFFEKHLVKKVFTPGLSHGKRSKYAFVQLASHAHASRAVRSLNNKEFFKQRIRVKISTSPRDQPPRDARPAIQAPHTPVAIPTTPASEATIRPTGAAQSSAVETSGTITLATTPAQHAAADTLGAPMVEQSDNERVGHQTTNEHNTKPGAETETASSNTTRTDDRDEGSVKNSAVAGTKIHADAQASVADSPTPRPASYPASYQPSDQVTSPVDAPSDHAADDATNAGLSTATVQAPSASASQQQAHHVPFDISVDMAGAEDPTLTPAWWPASTEPRDISQHKLRYPQSDSKYVFVTLDSPQEAARAVQSLRGRWVRDGRITINFHRDRLRGGRAANHASAGAQSLLGMVRDGRAELCGGEALDTRGGASPWDNNADFLRFEDSDDDQHGGSSEHEVDENSSAGAEKQAESMHDDKHPAAFADEHNVNSNSGVEEAANTQHGGDETTKHISKDSVKPMANDKAEASSIANSESPNHSGMLDSAQASTALDPFSTASPETSPQHTSSATASSMTTTGPSTNASTNPSTAPSPATSLDPITSLTALPSTEPATPSSIDLTTLPSFSTAVPTPQRATSAPPLFELPPYPAAASPERRQIEIFPNPWLTCAPCVLYYT